MKRKMSDLNETAVERFITGVSLKGFDN